MHLHRHCNMSTANRKAHLYRHVILQNSDMQVCSAFVLQNEPNVTRRALSTVRMQAAQIGLHLRDPGAHDLPVHASVESVSSPSNICRVPEPGQAKAQGHRVSSPCCKVAPLS